MSVERIEDSEDTPWWGEHVHRYLEAMTFIKPDMHVLDLACGNGFGTIKLLEAGARFVAGGDISDDALDFCREKYSTVLKKGRFEFRKLDATKLEFNNESFDMIVSFETIEHIADYESVIREFKRVLKKDGVLLLSTPNQIISSPNGTIVNPFHVKEFTYTELLQVLMKEFSSVNIGGQQYVRYLIYKSKWAPFLEALLLQRGIRKLGLPVRNALMQQAGVPQLYPQPSDYMITYEEKQVLKCPTFFAVCRK